jgi:hypothetical protein
MTWMARQGDILIVEITGEPPRSAREIEREPGGIVLAYGEATGHAHRIRSACARLLEHDDGRFLRIDEPVDLTHEEHASIHLRPGVYRVVRQREYEPQRAPRWVDD